MVLILIIPDPARQTRLMSIILLELLILQRVMTGLISQMPAQAMLISTPIQVHLVSLQLVRWMMVSMAE